MAFIFPEDKADFTAPNGVTYHWDGAKWVTKTFKADESALEPIVERLDEGEVKQGELTERVNDGELKQRQIELTLEELSITKGSVARYTVTETHIGAAIRNGELYVSSPNAADVQAISFAPFDINGQPTRPANTGDIIEFVETTRAVGEVTRYRIVNGGDSQALTVSYISGNNDFARGENEEVYIYPQNEEGVSKEYVDAQDDLSLKLAASNSVTTGFRIKNNGKTLISTATEGVLKLYNVNYPTENEHAANKEYVDDSVASIPAVDLDGYATEQYVDDAITDANLDQYFQKSGGTITGPISLNRGEKPYPQFKITPNTQVSNFATNIYSLGNGDMRFRTSHTGDEGDHVGSHIVLSANGGTPQTKIYHVVEAGESTAVPKSYVDNAVANAGGGTPPGPAALCWEWRNYDSLFDPGEGKVAWYGGSGPGAYRLNYKTANGADLGKNRLGAKDETFSNKPHLGIWTYVSGGWQLVKLLDIDRMQWNKNDCFFIYPSAVNLGAGPANGFTAGQKYYFTVGGFF